MQKVNIETLIEPNVKKIRSASDLDRLKDDRPKKEKAFVKLRSYRYRVVLCRAGPVP